MATAAVAVAVRANAGRWIVSTTLANQRLSADPCAWSALSRASRTTFCTKFGAASLLEAFPRRSHSRSVESSRGKGSSFGADGSFFIALTSFKRHYGAKVAVDNGKSCLLLEPLKGADYR